MTPPHRQRFSLTTSYNKPTRLSTKRKRKDEIALSVLCCNRARRCMTQMSNRTHRTTTEGPFLRHWQAEIIRQRELHWGPVADDAARRMAATCSNPDDKLLTRAARLCHDLALDNDIQRYRRLLTLTLSLLALLAVISGIALASSISPQHARTISLLDAMIALLLINTLLMIGWAAGMLIRSKPGGIGAFLLHYMPGLVRSPSLLPIMQAHTSLALHQGLMRPALSAVTHGFWLLLLATTFITLVIRFIGFDYQFVWRTTLLSETNVATLVEVLHIVPGLFAFEQPLVTFGATGDAASQRAIAIWLLACLFFYAITPRALLFIGCDLYRRYRLANLKVNWQLAGFSELREQLADAPSTDTDTSDNSIKVLPTQTTYRHSVINSDPAWFTLEWPLSEALYIPLAELPITPLGNVSSREERQQLLTGIARHPRQIMAVINPELTPDRGSLRLLAEISSHCPLALFVPPGGRSQLWRNSLDEHLKLPVLQNKEEAEAWLRTL
ncbi:hypothetical protein CWE12_04300 [Aliidiomarina sedimenti]|uniref:DUF2868 domain-containing protein n=2 Tax=Aliidiomarina sedimenti TaxID=1933879 RepID=A0ABY0C327_9GAMM|nr:hypothetical protein CWE12_04300 [Aliidiomarina sedimenti]